MTAVKGFDPRYNRHFSIPVLFYNPETFLIIHKPHDVRIDGPTTSSPTIESILQEAFPQHPKLRLVHQLDHVTSGVHVWALTRTAARHAASLFEQRMVQKCYLAIVRGHIATDVHEVNAPIAEKEGDDRKRMMIGTDANPGRPAKTLVRVIRRGFMVLCGRVMAVTLCELKPVSGRRHQLRVHMASSGHPIVGDELYEVPFSTDAPRTKLHAHTLYLPLPKEGDIRVEAPSPFEDVMIPEKEVTEEMKAAAESEEHRVSKVWMRFGLDGTPVDWTTSQSPSTSTSMGHKNPID